MLHAYRSELRDLKLYVVFQDQVIVPFNDECAV